MRCECCGRETGVLIEIGTVSPKAETSGRCCADCCTFILSALEGKRGDAGPGGMDLISVDETQIFVDASGRRIEPEEIRFGVKDSEGRPHYFCLRKIEQIPETELFEIYRFGEGSRDTCYSFRSFGYRKTEEERITEVLAKLRTSLMNPVLEKNRNERAARYGLCCGYKLRDRGSIEIVNNGEITAFRIDGELVTAEELADYLGVYEGFTLTYQIRDPLTAMPPDYDTYYMPVQISDEILMEELETLIAGAAGKNGFVSYRDTDAFDTGFFRLCDKLELYARSNPPGIGKAAGLKLISRLKELETDDDTFPEYEIEVIRNLTDLL